MRQIGRKREEKREKNETNRKEVGRKKERKK